MEEHILEEDYNDKIDLSDEDYSIIDDDIFIISFNDNVIDN